VSLVGFLMKISGRSNRLVDEPAQRAAGPPGKHIDAWSMLNQQRQAGILTRQTRRD
jgi:hypothetical protein